MQALTRFRYVKCGDLVILQQKTNLSIFGVVLQRTLALEFTSYIFHLQSGLIFGRGFPNTTIPKKEIIPTLETIYRELPKGSKILKLPNGMSYLNNISSPNIHRLLDQVKGL